MATRAVYSFTGFPKGPVRHCYLHHDGYPTGAAWRFANAPRERPAAAEFLAAFLRSQPGAEALADRELTVQGCRRLPGSGTWHPRCGPMALAVFIERFLPGGIDGNGTAGSRREENGLKVKNIMVIFLVDPPPDRLPPLPPEQLSEAQRQAVAILLAGPRSTLEGPFIPLLRSPALMTRLQQTGAYLRFESPLPARLRELVILWVARQWNQPVEWAVHHPLALAAGLAPAVLEAIREGQRPGEQAPEELAPESLTPEEWLALDVCEALSAQRDMDDATYARAVAQLGEAGLVDLIALVGYYGLLALVLNVARTPAPPCPAPLNPPAGGTSCGPAAAPCPPAPPPP